MARKHNKRQPRPRAGSGIKSDITALYIRVSTDKQADEGFSLDDQRDRLIAYCVAQRWPTHDDHVYIDAGFSGKSTDRASFKAMLEAANAGGVRRIVAMKLDRLARNVKDFLTTVDQLKEWDCALVLVKESFDTSTPHGKFALTMFAAMAELEAATITERVMSGKTQKASMGGYNGSRPPLGYTYQDEKFVQNEHAGTIRLIFSMFTAGDSLTDISVHLNATGAPTARRGRWHPATVRYILTNGLYAGLAQWDGVENQGTHEAIVSRETYEAAHVRLTTIKPGPQR